MKQETITFWLGCHVLRHSDLIRTSVEVLKRIGVDARTVGGPKYCCGTIKDMNLRAATGMGQGAVKRFTQFGNDTVITYCPSCQTHLDDFISETVDLEFDYSPFVEFLHAHKSELAAQMNRPIHRRVALHLHSGFQLKVPINQMATELLMLIPGLEVVQHDIRTPGIHCTGAQVAVPGMSSDMEESLRRLRNEYAVDDVVTIFHSCQRQLCIFDGLDGLRLINFIKLLGSAMGIEIKGDVFGEWKNAGDEVSIREAIGEERIDVIGREAFEKLILPELKQNVKV